MKRYFLFLPVFFLAFITAGQPLTGTKTIPGNYPTITAAVADLNNKGVGAGGVTFNIAAGYTEMITATVSVTATGTETSPVVFRKSGFGPNPLITACIGTATPSSAIQDGIWKLVGSDYVTIDGINLKDPNTTNPATMEYGFGLFKKTEDDGCRHNLIKNCVVTLNRVNNATGAGVSMPGSRAINMVNALDISQTTGLTPASAAGTNSYNRFYGNILQNCNIGIALMGYDTWFEFDLCDTGNDMGGTSVATGNKLLNFGGAPSAQNAAAGIAAYYQWGVNISFNTFNNNNGAGVNHPYFLYAVNAEVGRTAATSILSNNITLHGGGTEAGVFGIYTAQISTPVYNTVEISGNTITGSYLTATTGSFVGIYDNTFADSLKIKSNTISGVTLPGEGLLSGIFLEFPNRLEISSNMVSDLTKTGEFFLIGIGLGGETVLCQNNIIDGLSHTGISGTSYIYGIYVVDLGINTNESYGNNTVRNLSSAGLADIFGIYSYCGYGYRAVNMSGTQCYNFSSQGGGSICGIYLDYYGENVTGENTIHDLHITGTASGNIFGIWSAKALQNNLHDNHVYSLGCAGGTGGFMVGLAVNSGSPNHIINNEINDLTSGSTNPGIDGIGLYGGHNNYLYNNFISDLRAPAANALLPLKGIDITGGVNHCVFHNTVFLSANSSSTLFGSTAVFVNAESMLDLRNNILVNNSVPNGSGVTSALCSQTVLSNSYSQGSNANAFYAGPIEDAHHAVCYDGTTAYTLSSFKSLVGPSRDNISFREIPPFNNTATKPYDLRLQNGVPTSCESDAVPVNPPVVITDDFDGDIRQGSPGYSGAGTAPDVGADEFGGIPAFTCTTLNPGNTMSDSDVTGSCEAVTLFMQNPSSGPGLMYQWQNSPDGITFSDIPGARQNIYTFFPSSSMYFRCMVTCLNSFATGTSNPLFIPLTNSVLSTTPGSRCGIGTVQLSATNYPAATLKWYPAASGGTAIATGSPFTTPTIDTTTSYYVGSEFNYSGTKVLGNGNISISTSPSNPFSYFYGGQKNQFLVRASELQAVNLVAGNITSLSFDVATVYGIKYEGFNLSMGHTALNEIQYQYETGLTTVFSTTAPAGVTPVTGIFTINFTTPFAWDGISNIIFQTCWSNNNSGSPDSSAVLKGDNIPYAALIAGSFDVLLPQAVCAHNEYDVRYASRMKLMITGTSQCSSPRSQVVASVTPAPALTLNGDQTVCNNAVATLSVISDPANFTSYVWTPATNLFQDPGCTMAYVAGSSKPTVYAKSSTAGTTAYTCTAEHSVSLCRNMATAAITVAPANPVIAVSDLLQCFTGSATLKLSPGSGYGTASFQWQSSADSLIFANIPGATTTNYVTPTVTTTTYYRLLVTTPGNNTCSVPGFKLKVFQPQITGTVPGSHCGPGAVALGATVASGTPCWYSDPTGGTCMGTGALFTTPVIETTTTFYVEAANTWGGMANIGNGANNSEYYESPFSYYSGGLKNQFLIRAEELHNAGLAAGNLTALSFDVVGTDGVTLQGFNMGIGHTVLNELTEIFQTGLTNVFSTAAPNGVTPTTGIFTISFSTPFPWDGISNIIVETCWSNNNSGISHSNSVVKVDPRDYISQSFKIMNNQTPGIMCSFADAPISQSICPKMIFSGLLKCAGPRSAVTATIAPIPQVTPTIAPSTVCAAHPVVLSVTSPNPGYSYAWNPGNLTGATQTVYPESTTAYTVTAMASSISCTSSASVTASVLNSPTPISITPAAPVITSGQIQPLTASGGQITPAATLSGNFNGTTSNNGTNTGSNNSGNVVWSPVTALFTDAAATVPYTGGQLATVYAKPTATITYTATSVNPVNGCDRTASVTVTIPTVPENLNVNGDVIGNGQTACYDASNMITVSGFTVQPNGFAHFIAGSRIFFNPPVQVHPGGYLHGKIAPGGPFCSSTKMTAVISGMEETPQSVELARFILCPNPTNGNFTLLQKGESLFNYVRVEVYNINGKRVLTENMVGEKQHEFLFSDMPPAMYFVKVVAEDYVETIKLVKTR